MSARRQVLVTGASGEIGRILRRHWGDRYDLTLVDLHPDAPEVRRVDLAGDPTAFARLLPGHDAVVHLAAAKEEEADAENVLMAKRLYAAALAATAPSPRLVVASSIHALGGHWDWQREPWAAVADDRATPDDLARALIRNDLPLYPNGVYGAMKGYLELLGRHYADLGLEVVALRYGGVTEDDAFRPERSYASLFLSAADCARITAAAIEAALPRPFGAYFAVSANRRAIHDLRPARTDLGYSPGDGRD